MAFSFFKKSDKEEKKEEVHSGPKYYDLTVKDVVQETKEAISIVFEQPAQGRSTTNPVSSSPLLLPFRARKYAVPTHFVRRRL
jgi:ring-1,2-phenylacetyl-CoA epoxidase subunit PaaE